LSVRVKICGITRLEDALRAAELGADALGFNFWPGSKRHVAPEAAREIIARLPPFVTSVGLFVNQDRELVRRVSALAGIAAVQLHGDEPPEECEGLSLPVIKAFRPAGPLDPAALARYRSLAAVLLDAPSERFGGSGRTFDWELARGCAQGWPPLILAGGLTPENVAGAVRTVRPWAVDVASGVELDPAAGAPPGAKDPNKMARFIRAAKEA
jgi:phosphoribosylanthranilate isomerase